MASGPLLVVAALQGCAGGGSDPSAAIVLGETKLAAVTSARSIRLFRAFTFSVLGPLFAGGTNGIQYDGNLYYSSTQTGNIVTVNYYTDAAGTQPAGTIVATIPADLTLPITIKLDINITGGIRPSKGTASIISFDEQANHFELKGNVDVKNGSGPANEMVLAYDLDSNSGVVTGSMQGIIGPDTVQLNNIQMMRGNNALDVNSNVKVVPAGLNTSEQMVLNDDTSGTVVLGNHSSAAWKVDGSGTVTLSDGTTAKVQNVDQGQ